MQNVGWHFNFSTVLTDRDDIMFLGKNRKTISFNMGSVFALGGVIIKHGINLPRFCPGLNEKMNECTDCNLCLTHVVICLCV